MKLNDFKKFLETSENFKVSLNGEFIPKHFHITEMGIINKKYTDCGNTFREENYFTFQLWTANDIWHRLEPQKVLNIISKIEGGNNYGDFELRVEFQHNNTIGIFSFDFDGENFVLSSLKTQCLASDACGIPVDKIKKNINEVVSCCGPNTNCC